MPSQHIVFPYPDGGMNEGMPQHMIGDNQFTGLENWYYNDSGKLVSRPGTEFIKRFNGYVHGIGALPSFGSAIAVQVGTDLHGRSAFKAPSHEWSVVKSGVIAGTRYFTVMDLNLYSGASDGSSTADNLKWDVTSTTAVTWPGSPPALSFVTTWNFRVWGIHRNDRTKLYFSKLGDAEDWTATGVSGAGYINIGYDDGDHIISLIAHNEQLFILKRRSIWHIVTGNPNTDNTLWRVEVITHNYGCTGSAVVVGNDVLFSSDNGIISMNAALYQGDFRLSSASQSIIYGSSGATIYNRSTGQHLHKMPTAERGLYVFDKAGQNIRWSKFSIRDARYVIDAPHIAIEEYPKMQVWTMASEYPPLATFGDFAGRQPSVIAVLGVDANTGPFSDLLQYPTTYPGAAGHYDYIGGPDGQVPIVKEFKSKMHTFGNLSYEKRSTFVSFSFFKNDREALIENDLTKFSIIFNGNDVNEIQQKTITDVGTEVIGPEVNTTLENQYRSPLRTAVMGVGGAEGRVYKSIQFQVSNAIGGYELEYAGIETDVEQIGKFPKPSAGVLS